jgi:hypothetical protein
MTSGTGCTSDGSWTGAGRGRDFIMILWALHLLLIRSTMQRVAFVRN